MDVFYTIHWDDGKTMSCKASLSKELDDKGVMFVLKQLVSRDPRTNRGKETIRITKKGRII